MLFPCPGFGPDCSAHYRGSRCLASLGPSLLLGVAVWSPGRKGGSLLLFIAGFVPQTSKIGDDAITEPSKLPQEVTQSVFKVTLLPFKHPIWGQSVCY